MTTQDLRSSSPADAVTSIMLELVADALDADHGDFRLVA